MIDAARPAPETDAPPTTGADQLLVAAPEAARMCGVSTATWWRWDAAGRIPQPIRIGATTRWRLAELREWTVAGCPDRRAWQSLQAAPTGRAGR